MGIPGALPPGSMVSDGHEDGTTVLAPPPGSSSYDGLIQAVNGKHYVMLKNNDAYEFSSFEEARNFLGYVCADAALPPERINTGHVMIAMESLMRIGWSNVDRAYNDSTDIPAGLPAVTDKVVQIRGFTSANAKIMDDTNGMGYLVPPSGVAAMGAEFFELDPSLTPEQQAVAAGLIFAKVGHGTRAIHDFNFGTDTEAPPTIPNPNTNITKLVEAIWGAGIVPNQGHVAALLSAGLLAYSDDPSTNGLGEYHLTVQGNSFLKAGDEQTRFIPQGNSGGQDARPDAMAMPVYTTPWFQGEGASTTLAEGVDLATVKGALGRFADSLIPRREHPTPYAGQGLPEIVEGSPIDLLLDAVFGTTTGRSVEQVQSLIAHGLLTYSGTSLTMTPKGTALLTGLQQAPAPGQADPAPAPGSNAIAQANQTLATLLQWLHNNPSIMNLFDTANGGGVDGYISWEDIGKVANRDISDPAWAATGFGEEQAKTIIGLARALLNTGKVDPNFSAVFDRGMMANGNGGFHTNWLPGFMAEHNREGTMFSKDILIGFASQ